MANALAIARAILEDDCAVYRAWAERVVRAHEKRPKVKARPASRPRAKEKKEKRLTKNEETARIRAAVVARAGGRCEVMAHVAGPEERCNQPADVMDHWLGGNGRRSIAQSTDTCWLLCRDCNADRTANWPSAEWWNKSFQLHCAAHGIPFVPHITRSRRSSPGRREP